MHIELRKERERERKRQQQSKDKRKKKRERIVMTFLQIVCKEYWLFSYRCHSLSEIHTIESTKEKLIFLDMIDVMIHWKRYRSYLNE